MGKYCSGKVKSGFRYLLGHIQRQNKPDIWKNSPSKVIASEARKCAKRHRHPGPQSFEQRTAPGRSSHIPRCLCSSKGNLDYSSSLVIRRGDLGEQSIVWSDDGYQRLESGSRTYRGTLQIPLFQDILRSTLRHDHMFKCSDDTADSRAVCFSVWVFIFTLGKSLGIRNFHFGK